MYIWVKGSRKIFWFGRQKCKYSQDGIQHSWMNVTNSCSAMKIFIFFEDFELGPYTIWASSITSNDELILKYYYYFNCSRKHDHASQLPRRFITLHYNVP